MPRIQAPDGKLIDFPDSMSDAAIEAAMGKLYPKPALNAWERLAAKVSNPSEPDSFWTSPHGLIRSGLANVLNGMGAWARGNKAAGAAQAIEGAATAASPAAIPLAIANPLSTIVGGMLGIGGQKAGTAAAEKAGASPETQRLAGDVSGLVAGPVFSRLAGALAAKAAAPLAESALGIRGTTHAYGATPGRAILTETSGLRPGTVEASARARLGALNRDLETAAANTPNRPSLAPARNVLTTRANAAASANSAATPAELQPLIEQLTTPRPGFTGATNYPAGANTPVTFNQSASPILGPNGRNLTGPITVTRGAAPSPVLSDQQQSLDYLRIKRQFNDDFVRNWNPATNTTGRLGAAREAYGALTREFNVNVPGAADLNQRIASLVPVAERARLSDLGATTTQKLLNRAARPTGGLLPVLFGAERGGPLGALAALFGLGAIESPAARLGAARWMYGTGPAGGMLPAAALARLAGPSAAGYEGTN